MLEEAAMYPQPHHLKKRKHLLVLTSLLGPNHEQPFREQLHPTNGLGINQSP